MWFYTTLLTAVQCFPLSCCEMGCKKESFLSFFPFLKGLPYLCGLYLFSLLAITYTSSPLGGLCREHNLLNPFMFEDCLSCSGFCMGVFKGLPFPSHPFLASALLAALLWGPWCGSSAKTFFSPLLSMGRSPNHLTANRLTALPMGSVNCCSF